MIVRVIYYKNEEVYIMKMKTGVEQSVYAILILSLLPGKAVLPGEVISQQLGASATYLQKLLRKLVSANLILSVPGVKGGFRLEKKPEEIRIYDIYLAIEGQQSLYASKGVVNDLLELEDNEHCCALSMLMKEAEDAWQSVLKKETVASLYEKIQDEYQPKIQVLQEWVEDKMVV